MVRCTPLWFTLLVAHATATPLRDGSFVTDRGSSGRLRIASGASRSRTGWTVEAEHESSDLRANFKINLRQCGVRELEETALAVSDPASPRYGKHLSAAQVCEIVSCPDRKDAVQRVLEWLLGPRVEGGRTVGDLLEAEEERVQGRWLRPPEGGDDVAVKVSCSYVAVSMSPSTAAAAFPEAALRPHRRRNVKAGKGGAAAAVLRATGDIFIPENLARHVEFIPGLTELWARDVAGGGAGKLDGAGAGRFGGMNTGDFTEVMIQPRTLRTLYGVPEGERGGWAGRGDNRQGVVAFDDFFVPADLCAAHNLLARDLEWLDPPEVTVLGPEFDPKADEAESDLDTQYMALMGGGIPVTFANHEAGQWVLDWAQDAAEGDLTPEKGGPLVWSISYGFPEEWQCYVSDRVCQDVDGISIVAPHGYDPVVYMKRSNTELAKLAAMGVSVLVASGDDGAGQSATCPVDPRYPVDMSGGTVEGMETRCPFDDREDCKCGSFEMELRHKEIAVKVPIVVEILCPDVASINMDCTDTTATSRCILPLGLVELGMDIGAPGAGCLEVLNEPDCKNLFQKIENGSTRWESSSWSDRSRQESEGGEEAQQRVDRNGGASPSCQMAFSSANMSFYSDCECDAVPSVVVGNCSLSGYAFQTGRDGSTPFAPSFPASSPWVTSVGATQVAWDLKGSCLQADLLGPDKALKAETAVNKFTGGFDGGGGFSTVFQAPAYQKAAVERYVGSKAAPPSSTFNITNRGFPDVSAAGHNYVVVIGGKVQQIGGTSASAPALAGMVSLMNERLLAAGKPPLGFLNPALYKAAADGASAFQPILPKTYDFSGTSMEKTLGPTYQVGSNMCSRYSCCQMGYDGSPDGSWDPVTGLGTINYQGLADYLSVPPGPPPPVPPPGHNGRDGRHAAYVAWIVVLVFCLSSVVIFIVYEHRPKLLLSAVHLSKSVRGRDPAGGGEGMSGYDTDEFEGHGSGGGWMGGSGSGAGYGRRKARGRPKGALTEMVMESEFGADADYRLLEDDGHEEVEGEEDEREERHGEGGREQRGSAHRSV